MQKGDSKLLQITERNGELRNNVLTSNIHATDSPQGGEAHNTSNACAMRD